MLVPAASGRGDELVRRYRLARLRLEPRDVRGDDRFAHLQALPRLTPIDRDDNRPAAPPSSSGAAGLHLTPARPCNARPGAINGR